MKRLLTALFVAISLSFSIVALAPRASAQVCDGGTTNCDPLRPACDQAAVAASTLCDRDVDTNPISGSDGIILRATGVISFVVGVVCVIIIVMGGLRYIFSQGKGADGKGGGSAVAGAKNQILYALIGLVITLLARSIIVFVINRL